MPVNGWRLNGRRIEERTCCAHSSMSSPSVQCRTSALKFWLGSPVRCSRLISSLLSCSDPAVSASGAWNGIGGPGAAAAGRGPCRTAKPSAADVRSAAVPATCPSGPLVWPNSAMAEAGSVGVVPGGGENCVRSRTRSGCIVTDSSAMASISLPPRLASRRSRIPSSASTRTSMRSGWFPPSPTGRGVAVAAYAVLPSASTLPVSSRTYMASSHDGSSNSASAGSPRPASRRSAQSPRSRQQDSPSQTVTSRWSSPSWFSTRNRPPGATSTVLVVSFHRGSPVPVGPVPESRSDGALGSVLAARSTRLVRFPDRLSCVQFARYSRTTRSRRRVMTSAPHTSGGVSAGYVRLGRLARRTGRGGETGRRVALWRRIRRSWIPPEPDPAWPDPAPPDPVSRHVRVRLNCTGAIARWAVRSHGVWGNWQPDGFWPR